MTEKQQQNAMWDTLNMCLLQEIIKLHYVWLLSFPENGWTVRFLIFPVFKSYFLKRCSNLQASNPDIIVLTAFFNLLCGNIWEIHLEAQSPFYIEFNITIILGRDRNNLESKMCDKFYFIYFFFFMWRSLDVVGFSF